MVKLLDILVVDDDLEDACRLARLMRARYFVRIAVGLRDAVHELAHRVPDVIVCALDMPPFRGDALLAMIASEHPRVRRVLYCRGPAAAAVSDVAAHAVLENPFDQAALVAAIGDE